MEMQARNGLIPGDPALNSLKYSSCMLPPRGRYYSYVLVRMEVVVSAIKTLRIPGNEWKTAL